MKRLFNILYSLHIYIIQKYNNKKKNFKMSSKPTQKFAATFYTQEKKKQPKTPPKV